MKRIKWMLALVHALALLSVSGPASAAVTISKSASTSWDPSNQSLFPKAIPGAQITYTTTVSNALGQSTARNINVTETIPAKTRFYVGTGNPVTVTIGALSPLTYSYVSLANPSDGLEFSTDNGANWTATPSANNADGSDSRITNIRVKTGGSLPALDSFTISFKVVVQ